MTWLFEQSTGKLYDDNLEEIAQGYSGHGKGKDNPVLEEVKDVGPIPCGTYSIGQPENTTDHGPYVLRLTPDASDEMFGRAGFLIHGDSFLHPGNASEGCIILPRTIREKIWGSNDHRLTVVATMENQLTETT